MAAGYSYGGFTKLTSPSWLDGSALSHVLSNPLARPTLLREWLLAQPELTFAGAAIAIAILGLSAGVEYDLMAYLVSRYFGMANSASIYGFLYAFFALGAGVVLRIRGV